MSRLKVPAALTALAVRAQDLLQGEPLRVIVYSAVAVVWAVTHIALALGVTRFGTDAPSLDAILTIVTTAAALVTEACRRFVYSPASVIGILNEVSPQDDAA